MPSVFDTQAVLDSVNSEIKELAALTVEIVKFDAHLNGRGEMPEGVRCEIGRNDIRWRNITATIEDQDGRPWRGLNGTAGIVFRIRQLFGVKKLRRYTNEYSGGTEFSGSFEVDDRTYWLTIYVGKGNLPETCELVAEEITETVTRTKYRTVCK